MSIGGNPYNLAFAPNGRYLVVLDWGSDTSNGEVNFYDHLNEQKVAVVSMPDGKVVNWIPQPGYPDLVTMEPTGRFALVTNRSSDLVSVIDLATHTQVRAISVGKAPHGMALRPAR